MTGSSPAAAWGLLAGGYAAVGLLTARLLPGLLDWIPACPFRSLTGLPCPTCRASRALFALARGDLADALACHPLAVIAGFAAIGWGILSAAHVLFPAAVPLLRVHCRRRVLVARLGATALLAHWAYLLASPAVA